MNIHALTRALVGVMQTILSLSYFMPLLQRFILPFILYLVVIVFSSRTVSMFKKIVMLVVLTFFFL